jgi:hypothetical protein
MALGGGRYEKETRDIRHNLRALGVILIVFNGSKGDGFEVHIPDLLASAVPKVLREIADEMEADTNQLMKTSKPS